MAANAVTRRRTGFRNLTAGGVTGNERLTALTGGVLIVLLAILGVTILRIGQLIWLHLFVGLVLMGPLVLKLASTGYRFARYYTRNPRYLVRGAPPAAMRLTAPIVVISTVVVMASGVVLLIGGLSTRSTFFPIHKVSFFVWLAFAAFHVLGHLPDLWRGLAEDYGTAVRGDQSAAGRSGRTLALASALTAGVVVAIVLIPQYGPWLNGSFHHH